MIDNVRRFDKMSFKGKLNVYMMFMYFSSLTFTDKFAGAIMRFEVSSLEVMGSWKIKPVGPGRRESINEVNRSLLQ